MIPRSLHHISNPEDLLLFTILLSISAVAASNGPATNATPYPTTTSGSISKTTPPPAALTETGLADTDQIFYSVVHTRAKGMKAAVEAPALCLVGQKPDGSSEGSAVLGSSGSNAVLGGSEGNAVLGGQPRAEGEGPCDFLKFNSRYVETARAFDPNEMKPAFWHGSRENPAPEQYSLEADLTGREINEALARLKSRCTESDCAYFNLLFVRGGTGLSYRLPLKNLKVSPAAKTVGYDPRDASFEIDNVSVRLIRR